MKANCLKIFTQEDIMALGPYQEFTGETPSLSLTLRTQLVCLFGDLMSCLHPVLVVEKKPF